MSVKLTLGELKASEKGLTAILTAGLPIKMSYNLQKGIKSINEEYKSFEESRTLLIKKYGKEKDGQLSVDPIDLENFEKFVNEYEELSKMEVELWFTPIKLEDIPETVIISPVELEPLIGKFIIDEVTPV